MSQTLKKRNKQTMKKIIKRRKLL